MIIHLCLQTNKREAGKWLGGPGHERAIVSVKNINVGKKWKCVCGTKCKLNKSEVIWASLKVILVIPTSAKNLTNTHFERLF